MQINNKSGEIILLKKNMFVAVLLAGSLVFAASAQAAPGKALVGIAMPTKSTPRWASDGANMAKIFKERGFKVELLYGEDDIPNQQNQIESMINKGAKVLIIGAIDGTKLTDVLQKAANKGVKIISYDRLIRDSKNVDYYVTFDNFQVGVLQGNSIINALHLKEGKGPFNIELFGGSPDDNNATFFYNGALSVLDPYIKSGKLVVRSKQMGLDKVGTLRWDGTVAQARMDSLLANSYTTAHLDAVLAANDGVALGALASLKGAGYGVPDRPFPIITGQDADVPSVKSIIKGEQYSTIFKDTRVLAKVTVDMVDAMLSGKSPEINDTKTYNNGIKVIPSYLLKPVSVDRSNWKQILVGSGYYPEDKFR